MLSATSAVAVDADADAIAEVHVSARAEPAEVLIGDRLRYIVEVSAPAEVEVMLPVLGGSLGLFSIVDFGDEPPRQEGDRILHARWYTLVSFDVGEPFIPPLEVSFRRADETIGSAQSNSVSVKVASVLEQEPDAVDIRDIKPPEEIPFDWTPYLVLAGLLLGGILLGALAYYLWSRRKRATVRIVRPAHEIAIEALQALRREGLIEAGEIAAFYVGLTRIVRIYLEDGLHLRAPEMTTEEFLALAGCDQRLTPAQRRILGDFLTQADLVKFARLVPTLRDCDAAFEAAQRFVDETRPRAVAAAGKAGGGGAP